MLQGNWTQFCENGLLINSTKRSYWVLIKKFTIFKKLELIFHHTDLSVETLALTAL